MSINYASPNRVGQSATFRTGSPDYLDISGASALDNAITVLAAVSEGSLNDGQQVGIYLFLDSGNYKVWTATLDVASSQLRKVTEERSVGTIANGTSVTVVVTDTSAVLDYYRRTPEMVNIVEVTGTSYTVTDADAGKTIRCSSASATTLTFSSSITNGAQFQIAWAGAGAVSIARSGSDTINGASANLTLPAQWRTGWVYKRAAGELEAYGFSA